MEIFEKEEKAILRKLRDGRWILSQVSKLPKLANKELKERSLDFYKKLGLEIIQKSKHKPQPKPKPQPKKPKKSKSESPHLIFIEEDSKKCARCRQVKDIDEFLKNGRILKTCIVCRNKINERNRRKREESFFIPIEPPKPKKKRIVSHFREVTSLKRQVINYQFRFKPLNIPPPLLVENIQNKLRNVFKKRFEEEPNKVIKISISFPSIFKKTDESLAPIPIQSNVFDLHSYQGYDEIFKKLKESILNQYNTRLSWGYISEFSHYNPDKEIIVKSTKKNAIKGSSYIPLPNNLVKKNAIINIKNDKKHKDKCFELSILAHKYPVDGKKHPNRVNHYEKHLDELNMNNIERPVKISDIHKFEEQNNVKITLFHYTERKGFSTLYHNELCSDNRQESNGIEKEEIQSCKPHIFLLLYQGHYCLIKSIDRLFGLKQSKKVMCYNCLQTFSNRSKIKFDRHLRFCKYNEPCAVRLPNEDYEIKFTDYKKKQRLPFVIYADFECKLVPCSIQVGDSTIKIHKHIPTSFCYVIVSNGEVIGEPVVFREKPGSIRKAPQEFVKLLAMEQKKLIDIYKTNIKLAKENMTKEEKTRHYSAKKCYLCEEEFVDTNLRKSVGIDKEAGVVSGIYHQKCCKELGLKYQSFNFLSEEDKKEYRSEYVQCTECQHCDESFGKVSGMKVMDHDHMTGKYRGPAHDKCNLHFNNRYTKIPVFIHNGMRYDNHLFVKELYAHFKDKCSALVKTQEDYISMTADRLLFLDSYAHLQSSLGNLVDNLKKSNVSEDDKKLSIKELSKKQSKDLKERFKILIEDETIGGRNWKDFVRKGVFPYEHINSLESYEEKELPPKEKFYSTLTGDGISDEDYEYAKYIFNKYECENIGDYNDLYLRSDVILLACIFENNRNICLREYKLDPAQYYTTPGLSMSGLLLDTKQTIKPFVKGQYDMYLAVEQSIRGGVSGIIKRFYSVKDTTNGVRNETIRYLDANNLYGYSMCQYLPIGGYKWDNVNNWSINKIKKIPDNSPKGYIFEVDLHYPENLHNYFRDYPPAPINKVPTGMSKYSLKQKQNLEERYNQKIDCKSNKLMLTLEDKKSYFVHYRNLKLYLKLGVQITKLHNVLEFDQSDWMRQYVEKNTELRKKATSEYEKGFYKLMTNSLYGKTIENVRGRSNAKLFSKPVSDLKLQLYKDHTIFSEDMTLIDFYKQEIVLDKPKIIGFCILELSKWLMYDFYYNMKDRYGSDMKLLFTDTDSLMLVLPKQKFEKDLHEDKELYDKFDFSNYPKDHILYSDKNKKVVGKMKSETANIEILEFCGLKAKTYSFITEENKEHTRCKGINKRIKDKELHHQDYKNVLFDEIALFTNIHSIRSHRHELTTNKQNKLALTPYDDKFYICDNGIDTLPYGYKDIKKLIS